jgi:hypothetical protein
MKAATADAPVAKPPPASVKLNIGTTTAVKANPPIAILLYAVVTRLTS